MSTIPSCAHCVKGKAVNQGHSRRTENSEVPIVSIDYAYVNEDGEEREKRKEDGRWMGKVVGE